jgi:hypothetical protein
MISFRPVVDDGVSSRREREEICFSKRITFEFREVFRKLASAVSSARATLGPKHPPQWDCDTVLLARPCVGLCAASAAADWHSPRSSKWQGGIAIGPDPTSQLPFARVRLATRLRDFRPQSLKRDCHGGENIESRSTSPFHRDCASWAAMRTKARLTRS